MKVYPYHTVLIEDERRDNVYHDQDNCPDGLRIKPEHRRSGPGTNRRKCEWCQKY